jgi:hypothetical protein
MPFWKRRLTVEDAVRQLGELLAVECARSAPDFAQMLVATHAQARHLTIQRIYAELLPAVFAVSLQALQVRLDRRALMRGRAAGAMLLHGLCTPDRPNLVHRFDAYTATLDAAGEGLEMVAGDVLIELEATMSGTQSVSPLSILGAMDFLVRLPGRYWPETFEKVRVA